LEVTSTLATEGVYTGAALVQAPSKATRASTASKRSFEITFMFFPFLFD
jgi:hypothetical protein